MNPPTRHYEFLGPPGALLNTLAVPAVAYALFFACNEENACRPRLDLDAVLDVVASLPSLWDTDAALIYLSWYAFCVFAWVILPGDWVDGTVLRDGSKKKYKINAFSTFLLALGIVSGIVFNFGPQAFTILYEKWVGLLTASVLMAIAQAVYCYASSFRSGALLALGGNSGNLIYDFFIGRELNPSIGSFDIKSFNELRPGLILWVLINISMACEQAVRRGGFLQVTDSMWLVLCFQFLYVADGLYNEPALFTTMDITTDGFGFMLAIGDLAWVPFTYSLQARYLAFHPVELGPMGTAAIIGVNLLGYWIFRTANNEKNEFRSGRNPKGMWALSPFFSTATHSEAFQISNSWRQNVAPSSLFLAGGVSHSIPIILVTSSWPSLGPSQPCSTLPSPTSMFAISLFFLSIVNVVTTKPAKTSTFSRILHHMIDID
ncbi:erg24, C-14 sterol reductase [Leucoagaricus gongylophorus]